MSTWQTADRTLATRVEAAARARLSTLHFDVVAGGAGAETAARSNTQDWEDLRLRPHVLRDVRDVTTTTTCLGAAVPSPVLVAPMGCQELMHPDAEIATSRGAAHGGHLMVVAERAATTLEDVAAAGEAPRWFQVYLQENLRYTGRLVERAGAVGYRAVVMTVDAPRPALRLRDRDHAFTSGSLTKGNVGPQGDLAYVDPLSGNLTLDRLEWLVEHSPLPVVVKGVLRADDAVAAVGRGAAAVVVSNHGGRQLSSPARVPEALAEVAAAVGDRAEVYVDSGLRSGEHVLKALALGARGVLIGRPMLYALAVDGSDGVGALLEALSEELRQAMALCGVAAIDQIDADLVATGSAR